MRVSATCTSSSVAPVAAASRLASCNAQADGALRSIATRIRANGAAIAAGLAVESVFIASSTVRVHHHTRAGERQAIVMSLSRYTSWIRFSSLRSEEHTSELQSRLHLVCRL